MRKFTLFYFSLFVYACSFQVNAASALCTIGGVATATQEAICTNSSTTLLLTGYNGNIQWQSFNGTIWVNEIGAGSTTDSYTITPSATTDYRAFVTFPGCPDTTSNTMTIVVGTLPPPSGTGGTRCGYGPVTLSATGTGTLRWYDDPTAGNLVDTGNTITPTVFNTTSFYVESTSGGGSAAPLTTTFAGGNGFDGNMFDIEAINQVTITGFDGNFTNAPGVAEIWYRPGSYVGFTGSNAGWTFVDSVSLSSTNGNGVATPIPITVNVTIPAGQKYAFYVHYSGSVDYSNGIGTPTTVTAQDPNIMVYEGSGGAYFSLTNTPRIFNGTIYYSAGCASTRTPVVATVTQPDPITITYSANALCLGDSATLTASSNNAGFAYTWSPATGLNTTTGANVVANPSTTITYAVIGDDGLCADVDSITIDVGPTSVAGTAFTISDTVCSGATTLLTLSGQTGNIQWQSNDGSGWVNESGQGSDSVVYSINPVIAKTYRAWVVSGGCPPDSTNILSIAVITISTPTVVDSSRCGPGVVNLSASGNGNLSWYTAATGGSPVNTGPTYSPNVTATTTWYVENSAGSGIQQVGPPDAGIGNQSYVVPNNYGIQFDVSQTITLERVFVYPGTAGTVTVNLRQTQGGPVLQTASVAVVAGGLTPIPLNFVINPGTAYRLELENTSPQCTRNTTGAVWPYTAPGVPVTLTGNLTPNPNTNANYYFFYNWELTTGCKSTRVPVTATVYPLPPVPVITPAGNILTSSAATGNQWYLNGNILSGETGQNLTATAPGTYTVTVTDANGCSSASAPFTYTATDGINTSGFSLSVYPNPGSTRVRLFVTGARDGSGMLTLSDVTGKVVLTESLVLQQGSCNRDLNLEKLSQGIYLLELEQEGSRFRQKLMIQR